MNELLQTLYKKCRQYFTITYAAVKPATYDPVRVAVLPNPQWIPASMLRYGRDINGFVVKWEHAALEEGRTQEGAIQLSSLEGIYRDWKYELSLQAEPKSSRLHQFKVVDMSSEYLVVGIYHDAHQDEGLYLYDPGDIATPYPLYLNMEGYIRMLAHSMGYTYWQLAVLALLADDGHNPAHQTNLGLTDEFRSDMAVWVPEFSYEAFVACYQEVKLKDYTPSGLPGSNLTI